MQEQEHASSNTLHSERTPWSQVNMSSPPRFKLSRATAADLPEIAKGLYLCFPPRIRELLLGCDSEDDLPKYIAHLEEELRTNHHAIWIKVTETSTNRIVAGTLWKVFPNAGAPVDTDSQPMSWLEGEKREAAWKLLREMDEPRRKANPGGHVRKFGIQVHMNLSCRTHVTDQRTRLQIFISATRILTTAGKVLGA